ncbi:MAG: DUF3048 domain-containing protein [Lachnospiraceae bacterium]
MKKKKYGMTVVCMTIGIMMIAVSCGGKKQESTDTEVQTAVVVETQAMNATEAVKETESALPAGEMYSYLTGEPVSETIGKQRPYAIMINNIETSLPQSGVSQAEMIYEAQVESGITRLMAVFQDWITLRKLVLFVVPDTTISILPMIMMPFMYIMDNQSMRFHVLRMIIL